MTRSNVFPRQIRDTQLRRLLGEHPTSLILQAELAAAAVQALLRRKTPDGRPGPVELAFVARLYPATDPARLRFIQAGFTGPQPAVEVVYFPDPDEDLETQALQAFHHCFIQAQQYDLLAPAAKEALRSIIAP